MQAATISFTGECFLPLRGSPSCPRVHSVPALQRAEALSGLSHFSHLEAALSLGGWR